MSHLWTEAEMHEATAGQVIGNWNSNRIEMDSRKVQAGDVFIALKGERVDGHDYVADVFAKGAVAAIVEREMENAPAQLIVTDALQALADLGRYNRTRSLAKIIGITGSVGKTSTKDMLRLALSAHGETYATSGNYNNHIGTPFNLANMPASTKFGVFEMGMNHAGEISHLTKMVRPNVAAITCVEAVHLEFFESLDGIADAKAEIFEGLQEGGTALLNADQPYFEALSHKAKIQGAKQIIAFGEKAQADCKLLSYQATPQGAQIFASIFGATLDYKLSAVGRHFAMASLIALGTAYVLKLDLTKTAKALADFSETDGRGRVNKIAAKNGAAWLVNDSYNASPASMRAAFAKTNEVWQAAGKKGRKIALLGDMLELGETGPALHRELAQELVAQGFEIVYTAGSLMRHLHEALPANIQTNHSEKALDLLPKIRPVFMAGDVVLIKGSHGSKIYEVAAALLAASEGEKKHAV